MSRWIYTDNGAEETVTAETNALIRMIKKLPSSSRVVIIEDPPLPTAFKIPDCLSTSLNDYRKCAYARKTGFGSSMGAREIAASKATGAGLIDLTAAVCPGTGACPVVINNMIVWRDQHHLTATFAASLAPAMDAQLVAILNAWDYPGATGSPSPSRRRPRNRGQGFRRRGAGRGASGGGSAWRLRVAGARGFSMSGGRVARPIRCCPRLASIARRDPQFFPDISCGDLVRNPIGSGGTSSRRESATSRSARPLGHFSGRRTPEAE